MADVFLVQKREGEYANYRVHSVWDSEEAAELAAETLRSLRSTEHEDIQVEPMKLNSPTDAYEIVYTGTYNSTHSDSYHVDVWPAAVQNPERVHISLSKQVLPGGVEEKIFFSVTVNAETAELAENILRDEVATLRAQYDENSVSWPWVS